MSKHRGGAGKRLRYRNLILKFRENHDALTGADCDLLQRWQESEDAVDALIKIACEIEPAKEGAQIEALATFIHFVLIARDAAVDEDEHYRDVSVSAKKREEAKLNKDFRSKLAKTVKEAPIDRLHEYMTLLHECMTRAKKTAYVKVTDSPDLEPSIRSNRNGSRQRNLFTRYISNMVYDLTNMRLDQEVGALVDIAFPAKEKRTADAIRSALRPSTRTGRKMSSTQRTLARDLLKGRNR
jgi:hypothetical protein